MKALLVVDMQVGLFTGAPRHDAAGVIRRINRLARAVREAGGLVIFIQHEDEGGLVRNTAGWEILPALGQTAKDLYVQKQACDSFYESALPDLLERNGVRQVIVTGCATDFCVDTTIRAAASRNYEVVAVADGHTTRDRPHLDAAAIIAHHNYMWANLILPRSEVKVLPTSKVIKGLKA